MERNPFKIAERKLKENFHTLFLLTAVACLALPACSATLPRLTPPVSPPHSPVVLVAGDIICDRTDPNNVQPASCQHELLRKLIEAQEFDRLLFAGDLCHRATKDCFSEYNDTFGEFADSTLPVPGNHDYLYDGANPYFTYWRGKATNETPIGEYTTGYYSINTGGWHIVLLNSECDQIGGCDKGSPEFKWLEQDLKDNPALCTLAAMHRPFFTSGVNQPYLPIKPLFELLYNSGADIVVTGHEHGYERFDPQDPNGNLDLDKGIQEIVVGTGGASLIPSDGTVDLNSVVRNNTTYGAEKFVLYPGWYTYQFIADDGGTFTDSGSRQCH